MYIQAILICSLQLLKINCFPYFLYISGCGCVHSHGDKCYFSCSLLYFGTSQYRSRCREASRPVWQEQPSINCRCLDRHLLFLNCIVLKLSTVPSLCLDTIKCVAVLYNNVMVRNFQVLEKHITLDKTMKGTDHVCSLSPSEFQQLVRDIRVIEASLGTPIKKVVTSGIYFKLQTHIVYSILYSFI